MATVNNMKKITILWIVLIILLLTSLSIIGINASKRQAPYKALENDIVEAMKTYYGQDTNLTKLPKNKQKVKITIGELESFGININNIIKDDECDGYGIVTGKTVSHDYKAYIKCKNYTTNNYEKYSK